MRKIIIFLLGLITVVTAGCASNQEVELLKQQNTLLKQQVSQIQEKEEEKEQPKTDNTYINMNPTQSTHINTTSIDDTTSTYDNDNTKNYCCKHCVKGKACGDSCINVNYTCHKWPGCACDD